MPKSLWKNSLVTSMWRCAISVDLLAPRFDEETLQCRLVPVTKEGGHVMQPKDAIKLVDENTIGIFVILGSTYTGGFENVKEMNDLRELYLEASAVGHSKYICSQWTNTKQRRASAFPSMVGL